MKIERFPRKHPMCTCPDFDPFSGEAPPDRGACRGGSIAHPVIDLEDVNRLVQERLNSANSRGEVA